jgi:hypothetical protein
MDPNLADKIRQNRESFGKTVKDSSLKVYVNNLTKINEIMNNGETKGGADWLDPMENVLKKLEERGLNFTTIRNYLNAILLYLFVLSGELEEKGKFDSLIKTYEKERDKLNLQYEELNASGSWTSNQEQNMISKEELCKVITDIGTEIKQQNLKKTLVINTKQKGLLQSYLLLNIHSQIPMRNELGSCLVMKKRDYNKESEENKNKLNYLIIEKSKMYFSLNDYKTNKTYQERYIEVPTPLKKTIRFYLRFFPGDKYLLAKFDGSPIGSNNVSQLLTKQFKKRIGKSVSTTLLRKLYLSDKYLPIKEQLQTDNHNMGHSSASAFKYYVKKPPCQKEVEKMNDQVEES